MSSANAETPPAAAAPEILIIGGTNRVGSYSMKLARVIERHYAAAGVRAGVYGMEELPREIFEPSAYAHKPAAFVPVQQRVLDAAGLHVVTPEYNGSFPGILKLFIDMLKFPESFDRKPVAFVGLAAGMFGAMRAVEQLQLVFGYRNAHVYPDRVFIAGSSSKFDAAGALNDPALDERVTRQARGFAEFAKMFARGGGGVKSEKRVTSDK
jgi:NAD(P)H-dependent FMN reductase